MKTEEQIKKRYNQLIKDLEENSGLLRQNPTQAAGFIAIKATLEWVLKDFYLSAAKAPPSLNA